MDGKDGLKMPRYRIHCLDEDGAVSLKFFIWCRDDGEAIGIARRLRHPAAIEVFRSEAMVAAIGTAGLNPV